MPESTSPNPGPSRPPKNSPDSLAAFAASPASLAILASGGKWRLFRHVEYLNSALLRIAKREIDRLMILMPPQHGKSELISRFLPAWWIGTHPDEKVILASYEHTYAASWGRKARAVMEEYGKALFGLRLKSEASAQDWWEVAGHDGAMYSAGSGGPLTGKGADLIILDDLLKNSEEAQSELIREKTFDWLQMTMRSRLHDRGAIVLISTRWHPDDPPGKLLQKMEEGGDRWEVIRLPALAEDGDPLGRAPGEALCPELYRKETLEATRRDVGDWIFETQYQAAPFIRQGNFFPVDSIVSADYVPPNARRCRSWDLAATLKGDWTAGVGLWRWLDSFGIWHVERFRLPPGERDERIKKIVQSDGKRVMQIFETQPGSAGTSEENHLRKLLAGYPIHFEKATGDKSTRAAPVASLMHMGRFLMLERDWKGTLLEEMRSFPAGKWDDQVDGVSQGFNYLSVGPGSMPGPSRTSRTCICMKLQSGHPIMTQQCPVHRGVSGQLDRMLPRLDFRRMFGGR